MWAALSSQRATVFQAIDPLYPCDCRLVQTLDAECGNFVEGCTTVLESMVRSSGVRAKCLPASPAPVTTALPVGGTVEAVANDVSGAGIFRQRAFRVWTAETLHRIVDPMNAGTDRFELGLK